MTSFITVAYTPSLLGLMTVNVLCKLTAVTDFDSWYSNRRYIGEELTLANPRKSDPASTDASVRLRICEEISGSGVFAAYRLEPVVMEDVYDQLNDPKYDEIFHRIYKRSPSLDLPNRLYTYDNAYQRKLFELTEHFSETDTVPTLEYVFVCLLKVAESEEEFSDEAKFYEESDYDGSDPEKADGETEEDEIREGDAGEKTADDKMRKDESGEKTEEDATREGDSESETSGESNPGDLVAFYVTKMYGTGAGQHRFALLEDAVFEGDEVMLVEEPASTSVALDFSIESHYLQLRMNHDPVSNYSDDPVCRLNMGDFLYNEHFRLCVLVFKSEYFEDKVVYPNRVYLRHCLSGRVSFQTVEGKQRGAAKSYRERMLACETSMVGGRTKLFYVSRAYRTNQVFVFTEANRELILEALVTNVNIVHEP